jgi:hypothetical protein
MQIFTNLLRSVLLGSAFFAASAASAAIIPVNPGVGTLQTAINNASSGDVLELMDGTYSASNQFPD